MGLINWCDSKITELKSKGIAFLHGRPRVPLNMRYSDIPKYIETYEFRNEIPITKRKKSLICFFSMEDRLWNRLNTIEEDCLIYRQYGGIVGMDLSPSVNMLRPRQLHSILLNSIYDSLVAIRGIKVAINARIGDFGTNEVIDDFPKRETLVFGNLGCKGKFASYSFLQFQRWLEKEKPKNICLYGTFSKKDERRLSKLNKKIVIHLYHCRNYRKKNKKSVFVIGSNKYTRRTPREGIVLKVILDHDIKKINEFSKLTMEESNCHGR